MINSMMGERAYRTKHIAKMLGMNIEVIRRHIREGKLKSYRTGREYYVTESQLKAYLEGK